ncbi:MAG TPA: hypothetical protein VMU04_06105 [Candidatus Acidoferrum sp.]|nr:hypothetical protein [Candidatus Acidoferrum sp.]
MRESYCTYAAPPRLADHRVDAPELVAELVALHANTYRWVAHPGASDLQELKAFLPLARAHNLRVWVTVIPPSERRPKDTRPLDQRLAEYQQWAVDFARLSLAETNFVAWGIDDFVWNLKFFTPEATRRIVMAAREVNPRFAFLPCCYFKGATAQFAKDYGPCCDGVMFPYRDESGGANLTNSTHVASEVKVLRDTFGPSVPIVVGVYASRHSKLGLSTPEYVEGAMQAAHACADGVSVFRHPSQTADPQKYEIVKRLFTKWTAPKP